MALKSGPHGDGIQGIRNDNFTHILCRLRSIFADIQAVRQFQPVAAAPPSEEDAFESDDSPESLHQAFNQPKKDTMDASDAAIAFERLKVRT